MKNLSKTIVKSLIIIGLFTSGTAGLSVSGISTVNEAHASVSYQSAYNYLVNHGYTVISLQETPERANEDWIGHTVKNNVEYCSTVVVSGTSIIGVEDVPF
ncbi:MAG: hypothetical protein ACJ77K_09395 [Bacteroidia bacterium]